MTNGRATLAATVIATSFSASVNALPQDDPTLYMQNQVQIQNTTPLNSPEFRYSKSPDTLDCLILQDRSLTLHRYLSSRFTPSNRNDDEVTEIFNIALDSNNGTVVQNVASEALVDLLCDAPLTEDQKYIVDATLRHNLVFGNAQLRKKVADSISYRVDNEWDLENIPFFLRYFAEYGGGWTSGELHTGEPGFLNNIWDKKRARTSAEKSTYPIETQVSAETYEPLQNTQTTNKTNTASALKINEPREKYRKELSDLLGYLPPMSDEYSEQKRNRMERATELFSEIFLYRSESSDPYVSELSDMALNLDRGDENVQQYAITFILDSFRYSILTQNQQSILRETLGEVMLDESNSYQTTGLVAFSILGEPVFEGNDGLPLKTIAEALQDRIMKSIPPN